MRTPPIPNTTTTPSTPNSHKTKITTFVHNHRAILILIVLTLTTLLAITYNPSSSTQQSPQSLQPATTHLPSSPPTETNNEMSSTTWFQKTLTLPSKSRGSYLITDDITTALPELKNYKVGILHLFIQHTSCALSLNENWDSDVRADMSDALDRIAPEDKGGRLYRHSAEGADDMPAHIKSALVGASVTVPISNGKLATGTWQGIWYLEFRTSKHSRKVVATIQGEKA